MSVLVDTLRTAASRPARLRSRTAATSAASTACRRRSTGATPFLERRELLTFEEIARVARIFVGAGVQKMRITGGEPLVRRDLERLIAQLAELESTDADDERVAAAAEGAGARRCRAAPDHGQPRLARRRDLPRAQRRRLPGRARARGDRRGRRGRAAGEGERRRQARRRTTTSVPMAPLFRERGHTLRFIEYMDVGHDERLAARRGRPGGRDRRDAGEAFGVEPGRAGVPRRGRARWRYRDGRGEVGVIASVTQPFCGDCTRARISAEGSSSPASSRVPRPRPARARSARRERRGTRSVVRRIWSRRADRYSELRSAATAGLPKVEMSLHRGETPCRGTHAPRIASTMGSACPSWPQSGGRICRVVGRISVSSWGSGSASPCCTSSPAGSPTATRRGVRQRARGSSTSRCTSPPPVRADLPELRRPAAPAARRPSRGRTGTPSSPSSAWRCSSSTCAGTTRSRASATRSCSRT